MHQVARVHCRRLRRQAAGQRGARHRLRPCVALKREKRRGETLDEHALHAACVALVVVIEQHVAVERRLAQRRGKPRREPGRWHPRQPADARIGAHARAEVRGRCGAVQDARYKHARVLMQRGEARKKGAQRTVEQLFLSGAERGCVLHEACNKHLGRVAGRLGEAWRAARGRRVRGQRRMRQRRRRGRHASQQRALSRRGVCIVVWD